MKPHTKPPTEVQNPTQLINFVGCWFKFDPQNDLTTRVNYSCFADTTLNTTIDEVTTTRSDVPTINPPVSSGNDMQDQVLGGLTLLAMQIFTLSTWFQLKFHS